jgi:hypothetical protein
MPANRATAWLLALCTLAGAAAHAETPVLEFCTCWKGDTGAPSFRRFAIFPTGNGYTAHWLSVGEVSPDGRNPPWIPVVRWDSGVLYPQDVETLKQQMSALRPQAITSSPLQSVRPQRQAGESWFQFTERGKPPLQLHFSESPIRLSAEVTPDVRSVLQLFWDGRLWMKGSRTMPGIPPRITGYCFKGWAQQEVNAVIGKALQARPPK